MSGTGQDNYKGLWHKYESQCTGTVAQSSVGQCQLPEDAAMVPHMLIVETLSLVYCAYRICSNSVCVHHTQYLMIPAHVNGRYRLKEKIGSGAYGK